MKCLVLALASLMALHASAGTATWKGSGDIEFAGTSTLHSWAGKVKTEPFSAIVVSSDAGQPQQLNATVQVKVLGMDTAEPDRNKNKPGTLTIIQRKMEKGKNRRILQ